MNILENIKSLVSRGNARSVAMKKNIIMSLMLRGISIMVSFLLVPMTLGYVNSELYGIWLTLSSIVTWLHFMDVGFTNGLKNKLGEAIAFNNWERGKSLVSTTYGMMLIIFLPICIVGVIVTPFINWSWCLNVDPQYNNQIADAMCVLIVCFCMQMILNVLISVIAAFQKVALSSSFTVIGNAVSLVVIFVLTKVCPPSLLALAFAIAAMPVVVLAIASFFFFSDKFKAISPSVKSFRKDCIGDLFKLGSRFFLIQIQMLILYQATNVLISNVSGPEDVTSYNIAYRYIGIAMMVYTILLQPLWPAFTDAFARKDFVWMRGIYKKMSKIYAICFVIVSLMIIISPFFYKLWIGDSANVPFIMTLCVGAYVLMQSWVSLQVNMINGIGAIKLQTRVTVVGLVAHIPLAVLLSHFVGAIGVVMSMIFINAFYAFVFTIQIKKLINQKAFGIWMQ